MTFVCFISVMIGKWSDILNISRAESKFHCSTSLMKMLSMNVALCWVILVGLVIDGNSPFPRMVFQELLHWVICPAL